MKHNLEESFGDLQSLQLKKTPKVIDIILVILLHYGQMFLVNVFTKFIGLFLIRRKRVQFSTIIDLIEVM